MKRDATQFVWLFSRRLRLIVLAPVFHGLDDRAHGLAERRQRVFNPGRYFRISGAADDAVGLHGAQRFGQRFLADAVGALLQLVEAPGTGKEISHNKRLPFAADQRDRGCHRAFGQDVFLCSHYRRLQSFQIECCIQIILPWDHFLDRGIFRFLPLFSYIPDIREEAFSLVRYGQNK